MLKINNLKVAYGNIEALKDCTVEVQEGEIVAMIGSNGAGKTTTLRTISGLEKPKSGSIAFEGVDLTSLAIHKIVELGIAHVPEGRRIFPNLSVKENLALGATTRKRDDTISADMEHVFELFPRLYERSKQQAGTLSGGEQQMLAVGRALMTKGKILLLDEPSMGLAPLMVESIFETIQNLNKQGMTILLVEQNAYMALNIAHRAYVLETGSIVAEGKSKEVLAMDMVKKAYLGI